MAKRLSTYRKPLFLIPRTVYCKYVKKGIFAEHARVDRRSRLFGQRFVDGGSFGGRERVVYRAV